MTILRVLPWLLGIIVGISLCTLLWVQLSRWRAGRDHARNAPSIAPTSATDALISRTSEPNHALRTPIAIGPESRMELRLHVVDGAGVAVGAVALFACDLKNRSFATDTVPLSVTDNGGFTIIEPAAIGRPAAISLYHIDFQPTLLRIESLTKPLTEVVLRRAVVLRARITTASGEPVPRARLIVSNGPVADAVIDEYNQPARPAAVGVTSGPTGIFRAESNENGDVRVTGLRPGRVNFEVVHHCFVRDTRAGEPSLLLSADSGEVTIHMVPVLAAVVTADNDEVLGGGYAPGIDALSYQSLATVLLAIRDDLVKRFPKALICLQLPKGNEPSPSSVAIDVVFKHASPTTRTVRVMPICEITAPTTIINSEASGGLNNSASIVVHVRNTEGAETEGIPLLLKTAMGTGRPFGFPVLSGTTVEIPAGTYLLECDRCVFGVPMRSQEVIVEPGQSQSVDIRPEVPLVKCHLRALAQGIDINANAIVVPEVDGRSTGWTQMHLPCDLWLPMGCIFSGRLSIAGFEPAVLTNRRITITTHDFDVTINDG